MDKPYLLGLVVLQLRKIVMYETYFNKLQPYFGQENLQLNYMDCDRFVMSIRTQNIDID